MELFFQLSANKLRLKGHTDFVEGGEIGSV